MNTHPLIEQFNRLRVLVLGDAMLDAYTSGQVQRFCPEGPVPVYDMQSTRLCAGGAANTAANLAALGAQVTLLTVVGKDEEGDRLMHLQRRQRIDTSHVVRCRHRRTLAKHRLLANQQILMRIDQGSTNPLDPMSEVQLLACLKSRLADCELVIVSDYGYGNATDQVIGALKDRPMGVWLCVDSKRLDRWATSRPDIVKPNYLQACRLLGLAELPETPERCKQMVEYRDPLLAVTGAQTVALTCDQDGCVCLQANQAPWRISARSCARPRVAGAGDTFLATMGLAAAAGQSLPDAARLASTAAGLVVDKECTAVCTAEELMRSESGLGRCWQLKTLVEHLSLQREHGERIVLTCGCFDILHHGHVEYLRRARRLGDRLIVAVNSDASIQRLKGPTRPINPLADRLEVLAALDCVDYLVTFDDDKPDRVIQALRPNVFVKGGDYTRETLPEADLVERLGGQVQFIPLVANRSTSRIIDRIVAATNH